MSAVLVETGPDKGAIWHFGEPNKEQKELAVGNAWADLSHRGVLSVTGKDRLTWLHSLTTQHLEQIPLAKCFLRFRKFSPWHKCVWTANLIT